MAAEQLHRYLDDFGVPYTTQRHHRVYSAQQVAQVEHVSGFDVAKTVMLVADGRLVMAVVPAPMEVELAAVRDVVGAQEVRMATEREFAGRFPDCEVGAEPPFGSLYGIETIIDRALTREDLLVVRDGTHEDTLSLATEDYLLVTEASVEDIAVMPRVPRRRVEPRELDPKPEGAWLLT